PVAATAICGTGANSAPPIAAAGVVGNDTDIDSAVLTASLVTGPANGTLTLNANGSFTYTPALNFNGSDSFTYKANGGRADSNVAPVTIAITAVDDAPVAADHSSFPTRRSSDLIAAAGVVGNDTDVDSAVLTASLVTGPASGTLTLNANGSFTYTPALNFNGSDSFT